jgi:polyisoprenyl-phosphate glycosyltransferase
MTSRPEVSIVVPVYGNAATLVDLHARLADSVPRDTDAEFVYIDDHSPDDSWRVLEDLAAQDSRVVALRLRENVGQQRSVVAGFDASSGRYLVVMDADLDDPPEVLPLLVGLCRDGYDCIVVRRDRSGRPLVRRVGSALVNAVLSIRGRTLGDVGSSFLAMHREVAERVRVDPECMSADLMLPLLVGHSTRPTSITVPAVERSESTYSLFALARTGVVSIVRAGGRPLSVSMAALFAMVCLVSALRWRTRSGRVAALAAALAAALSVTLTSAVRTSRPTDVFDLYEVDERVPTATTGHERHGGAPC